MAMQTGASRVPSSLLFVNIATDWSVSLGAVWSVLGVVKQAVPLPHLLFVELFLSSFRRYTSLLPAVGFYLFLVLPEDHSNLSCQHQRLALVRSMTNLLDFPPR